MSNIVPESAIPGKNGGWLTPGNPKATGRPKDKIRQLAAEAGNKAVQRLSKLLEQEDSKLSAQEIRSICDVLLKYGIGTKTEAEVKLVGDETFKQYFFEVLLDMDVDVDEFQRRLEVRMKG